jgi:predicted DNA-binding transcriptional regulator YafY
LKKDFNKYKYKKKSCSSISGKIVNILKLLNYFDSGKSYTVKELADKLEVTEKTVYRYFKTLKAAHIPIFRDPVTLRYSFHNGYTLKKIGLSNDEISVLVSLKKLVSNLGIPFVTSFNNVLDKVTYKAKNGVKFNNDDKTLPIWVNIDESTDFLKYEKIFSIISESIKERIRVRMTYYTFTRKTVTKRMVDPYGLIYSNGFWILVAYCHYRKEIRHFSIDNIRELEITDKHFFYPEDFKLENHIKGSWRYYSGKATDVLVKFDKEISHIILRRDKWHPTQKVIENLDGTITLSFTVAGTDEIKNWIYKFLPHCEVLAPPYLREKVKEELGTAIKKYKKDNKDKIF